MTRNGFDRRAFLKTTGALAGAIAAGEHTFGFAQAGAAFVRKDINSLDPKGPEILALRAGVAAMKAKPEADPTSWSFQANIHGMLKQTANPLWQQCQHGQWWFLPWHRMYLFYFERILRNAIQGSGTPLPADFALPYWNYSDKDAARVLPDVFRALTYQKTPGGPQVVNPLYEKQRRTDINDPAMPTPLDPDTVSYSAAFALSQFISSTAGSDGFGGQETPVPLHFPFQNHGALESSPHDLVHDGIGGLMGDPRTSANDPIFWLHHCNIDRLWNRWLAQAPGTNTNPDADSVWGTQTFAFADESGNTVTKAAYQFLEYVTGNLVDYKYDDAGRAKIAMQPAPRAGARAARRPETARPGPQNVATGGHQAMQPAPANDVTQLASFPPQIVLTGTPTTQKIALPAAGQRALMESARGAAEQPRELHLEIGGIDLNKLPQSGYYEVFVNLNEGATPSRKSPSYVGAISTFALRQQINAEGRVAGAGGSVSLPLTRALQQFKNASESPSDLSVTFVPRELPPSERNNEPRLTFHFLGVQSVPKPQPANKPK